MKRDKNKNAAQGIHQSEICLGDTLLFKYVDGRASKSEMIQVEAHLNQCAKCYHELTTLVRYSLSPATKSETNEIEQMRKLSEQEQVEKILTYHRQGKVQIGQEQQEKPFLSEWIKAIPERLKNVIPRLPSIPDYILRPAIGVACVALILIFSMKGLHFYNTKIIVSKARKIMLENNKIQLKVARLSGGYEPIAIGIQLSDAQRDQYLNDAEKKVTKAINKGNKKIEPKRLLAQVFLLSNRFSAADSIYKILAQDSIQSAMVYNDMGVYYFQQLDWKNAERYFSTALQVDENYLESYYNLALTRYKKNEYQGAIAAIDAYLKLEKNISWSQAASSLKNEIIAKMKE